jgi:biopolymer transport protein ExbD
MAFGSFNKRQQQGPMADMNMVPMIDVMLVLLVIFIITTPLLTHSVKVELPKASSSVNLSKPDHIQLGITSDGSLFWNGKAVTLDSLPARFGAESKKNPPPELHIRADRQVRYELVAQAMSAATKAGIVRIAFVTDPATAQ